MAGVRKQGRTLAAGTLTGLFFLQKYRFLTIAQFARMANFSIYHTAEVLRDFERWGHVGYLGFVLIPGHGKTPKVYYLKRKGFDLLRAESPHFEELVGAFTEVHKEATWTPHMYHRIKTIDLMISAECAVQKRPHLQLVHTFLSYRMMKKGAHTTRETTDFVGPEETSENKLVPDAAFIMENIDTQKRALFFVEMDMGTEQIISRVRQPKQSTIRNKLLQYDRYLHSLRYTRTYAPYGEFRHFTVLFVTTSAARVANIKRELADLPAELANYYRFTTYDAAMGDFLSRIWQSRSLTDQTLYPLVRE